MVVHTSGGLAGKVVVQADTLWDVGRVNGLGKKMQPYCKLEPVYHKANDSPMLAAWPDEVRADQREDLSVVSTKIGSGFF